MDPDLEQWREAKRIFDRLVSLPAERRRARLDRLQIAPEIRGLVLSLMAAAGRDGGLLEYPLMGEPETGGLVGRRLGPWVLEAELGRGGSAVVYRARADRDGTNRVAAVKLFTLGGLARVGFERFYQEQRILARLNHPHIAALFDVGRAEDGTPWLAMALVEGGSVDSWCKAQELMPGAIVQLFLDVCDAVAYAHRNLVIHRDIKPSNVLVDEHGHVRLLDFGIARLLDECDAATETQARMLTPQYAAPEQFTGAVPSTAMDVFGLGALLYRLLCGRPPRQGDADVTEPPTAPSRIVDDGDTAPSAAARRELRGDLDRIVLKALATRPEDRYAGAADLAADLRRWLIGEPVSATSPSFGYRARKFVARHRLGVMSTAALILSLLGGVVVSTWQAHRAQQEAARAQAVRRFVTAMLSDAAPGAQGGAITDVRQALARGAEKARTDELSTEIRAELLWLIGYLQTEYGQFADARRQLEAALHLVEQVESSDGLRGSVLVSLGVLETQEARYGDAIRHFDEVIRDYPDNPELLYLAYFQRASARQLQGQQEEALADAELARAADANVRAPHPESLRKSHEIALSTLRGRALIALGQNQRAFESLTAARDLITEEQPYHYTLHEYLGQAADRLGDWDEAERSYRHAVDLVRRGYSENSPILVEPYSFLAVFLRKMGQLDEAEVITRRSLALRERTLPTDSPALTVLIMNLGVLARDLGQYGESLRQFQRAGRIAESAYGTRHHLSVKALANSSLALAESGDRLGAERAIAVAIDRMESAQVRSMPDASSYAGAYAVMARSALTLGRPREALNFLDVAEQLGSRDRADTTALNRMALRVEAHMRAGDTYQAGVEARELQQRLVSPRSLQPGWELAETQAILARAALARGDYASASRFRRAALHRKESVKYPRFVEVELASLAELAVAAP